MTGYVVKSIVYFDVPGVKNTDKVVEVVQNRVKEGGVKFVVVASILAKPR